MTLSKLIIDSFSYLDIMELLYFRFQLTLKIQLIDSNHAIIFFEIQMFLNQIPYSNESEVDYFLI